jgi:dihydropteroate synthase
MSPGLGIDPAGRGQHANVPELTWLLGRQRLDCTIPRIMAVVNVTPDSFYDGSRVDTDPVTLRARMEAVVALQPDILDIGGQSTRPGSPRIGAEEELRRVLPALELARAMAPDLPITIDTYYSQVAREALAAGADGVNDISAGTLDPDLLDTVCSAGKCGYVLMHMQGTPETMQQRPHYDNVVAEVCDFFERKLAELEARGISRTRVALDPGIGFGKRLEDNLALIRHAGEFLGLGRPLVYGVSRKSFIKALDNDAVDAADRLPGTLAATWELLRQGVTVHRVHDVAEVRQVIRVFEGMLR